MATAKNDITGDKIVTKKPSDSYRDGWDRIFGNKAKDIPKKEKIDNKKGTLCQHYNQ